MIQIPKAPNQFSLPSWGQENDSDINGTLWASFNIDASENEGRIRVGKRLLLNTGTADDGSIGTTGFPVGFRQFTDNAGRAFWTVMGSFVYRSGSNADILSSAFVKDTNTNTPTDCNSQYSDIEIFNGELFVSRASADVKYLPALGSSWSTATGLGHGNVTTSFTTYANRLYCGGGSAIFSMDTSHSVATSSTYTVTIDAGLTITCIRASSNRIWILTESTTGGKGYIFEWDGTATQAAKSYRLESSGALACVIKDDIPYVFDTNGNLLVWNGGTFQKLAGLNRKNNKLLYNPLSTTSNRFIHPNGMSIVKGKINILLKGTNYDNSDDTVASIEETIPSGIYEYDETRGLVHKYSFGLTKSNGTITDYGQVKIALPGGLTELNFPSTSTSRNGQFLCGCAYYSDNGSTEIAGIFYDDSKDTLQKAGYFITTKLQAQDPNGLLSVQNTWQTIYTIYKNLLNSTDKIVVKYRVVDADPVQANITWQSTTTFTVLNSAVVVSNYWTSGTGGEVEIINGIGAGKSSHITNAVNNAGTWTVTVDETYTGATSTATARFQNWKKLSALVYNAATTNGVTYDQAGIGDLTNWVQFKVWMLFTGKNEIERMIIINNDTNPAN